MGSLRAFFCLVAVAVTALCIESSGGVRHTALKAAGSKAELSQRQPAITDAHKQHQTLAKNLLQTGDEWEEDLDEQLDDYDTELSRDRSNPDVTLVKKEKKGSEALNKLNAKLNPDSAANQTLVSAKEVPNEASSKFSAAEDGDGADKSAVKLTGKEEKQSEALNKLSAKIDKDAQDASKGKLADYNEDFDLEELADLEEQALDMKSKKSSRQKKKQSTGSGDLAAWEAAEEEAGELDYDDGEERDYDTGPQFIGEESSLETKTEDEERAAAEKKEEQRFENLIKEEAHQEALNTGKNPALLAHGTRNSSANATSLLAGIIKNETQSGEAKRKTEKDKFVAGYEELEDFDFDLNELAEESLDDDEISQPLTLPDESLQRAIDAHTMPTDPMPSKNTTKSKAIATAHEKGTLDTLKDLQNVVAEDELDDSLDLEKEAEVERLLDHAQAAKNTSSLKVDKSTQQIQHVKSAADAKSASFDDSSHPHDLSTSERSSSVITQGVIMGGTIKDAVQHSSTAVRIAAIIIAAVAGVLAAWGSISLYNRFRPVDSPPLPKVIEIGGFGRRSPSYAKVKTRGEDQNSSNWSEWGDDDWDDHAANTANTRRGSSVKQKRQQKWDDDW